jgi:hypothetical protein
MSKLMAPTAKTSSVADTRSPHIARQILPSAVAAFHTRKHSRFHFSFKFL